MNVKDIEQWNNGYVLKEYKKNAIHKFCAAVKKESEENNCSIKDAYYNYTLHYIAQFSAAWTKDCEVIPVSEFDDVLNYFFNPQKDIPLHIFFWFNKYYCHKYAPIAEYSERHNEVYNELQKEYIRCHRLQKKIKKEDRKAEQERRRKICQIYKSGKYPFLFNLYGKPLDSILDTSELDDMNFLFATLFGRELSRLHTSDNIDDMVIGYLIGMLQGERNAKTA